MNLRNRILGVVLCFAIIIPLFSIHASANTFARITSPSGTETVDPYQDITIAFDAKKDNFTQMDILTKYNCEYY